MQNELKITTEKEFIEFLNKIDDEEFIKSNLPELKNLSISMKIEGDNFESSLTGSLITALANYQEKIYDIYKSQKYGINSRKQLSIEEKQMLEIKVCLKPGCTDVLLTFVKDIVPEVIKKMNGEEIVKTGIIIAGIVSVVWGAKSVASTYVKEHFKTRREEIRQKQENEENKEKADFYRSIENVATTAIEGMRSLADSIVVSAPDKIEVDNKEISVNTAQTLVEEMKKPRKESKPDNHPDMYSLSGEFKVLNINYEHPVTLMKAQFIETGEIIDDISLQDDWMKEENMNILKDAQERDPVIFRVMFSRDGRSKRFLKAIDVNSIKQKE